MAQDVWVYAELLNGSLKKTSLQAFGAATTLAQGLGGSASAILFGGSDDLAAAIGQYGPTVVYRFDGDGVETYSSEKYGTALARLARDKSPAAILMGCTSQGRDLGPRLAAKLGVGIAPDCTAVDLVDGELVATRPVYAGKAIARVSSDTQPLIISVRPNVMPVPNKNVSARATVEQVGFTADADSLRKTVRDVIREITSRPQLLEADIIVTGGRGMKGPENYAMLEELADLLGAAVGASRAAVDAGWRDHSDQVGQTGKTVAPTMYIACGVSGAIQHLAGMKTSKFIVAVNKDPDAPIFNYADYGIVGDLFEVVPMMIEEVKKLKANG